MKTFNFINLCVLFLVALSCNLAHSEQFEVAKSLECEENNCFLEKSVCVQSATTTTKLSCEDYLLFKNAFDKNYCKFICEFP